MKAGDGFNWLSFKLSGGYNQTMIKHFLLGGATVWAALLTTATAGPATFTLAGDWMVRVVVTEPSAISAVVAVTPPERFGVVNEPHAQLPLFNPAAGGWARGAALSALRTQETTAPGLLEADSFVLRAGPGSDAPIFERGKDYELDAQWATFGRTTNRVIQPDQTVYASYRHRLFRLDAVVLTAQGGILVRQGEPRAAAPLPPPIKAGERHLGNIWLSGDLVQLTADNLFPILETVYPAPPQPKPAVAERLLPQTLRKLQSGEPLRVLAWGDSVTVGTFVPDWEQNRWQNQFVTRLRQRFPKANIELITEAWGGRNTSSYLNEPPGSPHNYREKVLDVKPDLIVSEFVNDAGLNPEQVEERYGQLRADFAAIGAEWIILTPHYVRPDWMGLDRQREIDDDPRPYVAGLRQFAARHQIALADAAKRYGRLWRQGIPYSTLMLNSINHPDERGMKIFADALLELFP